MPDNNQSKTAQNDSSKLKIPDEVKNKFPDLVELIKKSESMNFEERQYWVDVLPIMTDEQIENLRSILNNEKKQIEEVEKGYKEGVKKDVGHFKLEFDEIKYKEKKRILKESEVIHEKDEQKEEAAVLAEINSL